MCARYALSRVQPAGSARAGRCLLPARQCASCARASPPDPPHLSTSSSLSRSPSQGRGRYDKVCNDGAPLVRHAAVARRRLRLAQVVPGVRRPLRRPRPRAHRNRLYLHVKHTRCKPPPTEEEGRRGADEAIGVAGGFATEEVVATTSSRSTRSTCSPRSCASASPAPTCRSSSSARARRSSRRRRTCTRTRSRRSRGRWRSRRAGTRRASCSCRPTARRSRPTRRTGCARRAACARTLFNLWMAIPGPPPVGRLGRHQRRAQPLHGDATHLAGRLPARREARHDWPHGATYRTRPTRTTRSRTRTSRGTWRTGGSTSR